MGKLSNIFLGLDNTTEGKLRGVMDGIELAWWLRR